MENGESGVEVGVQRNVERKPGVRMILIVKNVATVDGAGTKHLDMDVVQVSFRAVGNVNDARNTTMVNGSM